MERDRSYGELLARVSAVEAALSRHEQEILRLREFRHQVNNELMHLESMQHTLDDVRKGINELPAAIKAAVGASPRGDDAPLTRFDGRYTFWLVTGTVTAVLAFLKAIGKL